MKHIGNKTGDKVNQSELFSVRKCHCVWVARLLDKLVPEVCYFHQGRTLRAIPNGAFGFGVGPLIWGLGLGVLGLGHLGFWGWVFWVWAIWGWGFGAWGWVF